jgi:hypothetical protein
VLDDEPHARVRRQVLNHTWVQPVELSRYDAAISTLGGAQDLGCFAASKHVVQSLAATGAQATIVHGLPIFNAPPTLILRACSVTLNGKGEGAREGPGTGQECYAQFS